MRRKVSRRLTAALLRQKHGYFSRQKHDFSGVDKEVRSILLRRKSKSKSKSRLRANKSKKKKLLKIVSQKMIRRKPAKKNSKKGSKIKRGTSKPKRGKRAKAEKSPKPKAQKVRKKKIQAKAREAQLVKQGPAKKAKTGAKISKPANKVDKLRLSQLNSNPKKLQSTVSLKQIMRITNQIKKKTSQLGIPEELGKLVDDLRQMVRALNCGSQDDSQNKSSSGNVMNYNINNFQNINNIRNLKWEARQPLIVARILTSFNAEDNKRHAQFGKRKKKPFEYLATGPRPNCFKNPVLTRIDLNQPQKTREEPIFESQVVQTSKHRPLAGEATVVTENVDEPKRNRFQEDLSRPVRIEHVKKHSYPLEHLKTPHRNLR